MAEFKKVNLELNHKFDGKTGRHYINNFQSVFHCHHYTTLTTQLALDAGETELLENVAEESFYKVIKGYIDEKCIEGMDEKVEIAKQYYSAIGLGNINVVFAGIDSGEVVSPNSHIEEGWIKKWGKFDKPVNFIGAGYVKALFAAVFNQSPGSYSAKEHKSIVKGDEVTLFKIVKI